jgi:hypothetical protein
MKKILILSIVLIAGVMTQAALSTPHYSYTYDAAGNRIGRIWVTPRQGAPAGEATFKNVITNHDITLFPNPTEGWFSVRITNLTKDDTGSLNLFDMSGKNVYNSSSLSEVTNIDLSRQPAGTYFMKIKIGEKEEVIKIVKRE